MELKDKICVVTGAASGIGRSLCHAFANEGARHVICVDVNGDGATATANEIGGHAFTVDVSNEAQIVQMIDAVEQDMGPIDLFFSNAGIGVGGGMEFRNISKLAKLKHRQIILKPLVKSKILQNGILLCPLKRIKKELKLLGLKNY